MLNELFVLSKVEWYMDMLTRLFELPIYGYNDVWSIIYKL